MTVKCVIEIEAEQGVNERSSNEEGDTGSQEKLLALIDQWPVPKPTQVVKASSLR